jgi:LCP family protein required for cell wall assembly
MSDTADLRRLATRAGTGAAPVTPSALTGRRASRRARRVRWPRLIALLLIAALLVGGGVDVLRAGGRVPAVTVRRPSDPITVLVMSTEDAPAYAGPQLTDSMMVWSYDPATRQAAILSVPRDLWVDIPGYGYERINAAFEDGGPQTAILAVERYIGVPIEYYAIVDYNAFVKLVNDVGGIDVNVPYEIVDTCYPNVAENRCTVLRIHKGPQHMDGATALEFARERHALPEGDLSREADQQLVLFALKDALLQPGNLLNLPKIIGDMQQLVTTNLPYKDVPALAEQVLKLPKSAIAHAVLDYSTGAVSDYTTSGGADVLLPHAAAIAKVVQATFGPVLAHMTEAPIQVENGAPTDQPLATYFSDVLKGMGATVLPARQADRTDYAANVVYWNTAAAGGRQPPVLAYMLAQMLNTQLTVKSLPAEQAPIVVILGSSFPKVQP